YAGTSEAAASGAVALAWEGPTELTVGEEATIVLQARSDVPLHGANVQLSYDPAALRVLQVSEGELLRKDGGATTFAPRVDPGNGLLSVAMTRVTSPGVTGEGSLLVLRIAAPEPRAEPAGLRVLSFSAQGAG